MHTDAASKMPIMNLSLVTFSFLREHGFEDMVKVN